MLCGRQVRGFGFFFFGPSLLWDIDRSESYSLYIKLEQGKGCLIVIFEWEKSLLLLLAMYNNIEHW